MGIFLVLFFLINHSLTAAGYHYCYPTGNFTRSSEYASFRDSLLFSLAERVKNQDGFYYGYTITFPPAPVPYCLGLCRKDLISSDACFDCISNSSSEIIRNCPTQKEVSAWGEDAGCFVRCMSHQISQSYEIQPVVNTCNATNISTNYVSQFGATLANLTSRLAVRAADEGSSSFFPTGPQYFATEESKLDHLLTIYGVGFCLPSLSKSDCTSCLQAASNQSHNNCHDKVGATIVTPSCVLRYEVYPFYKSAASYAPLPSLSPPISSVPASSSSDVSKEGSRSRKLALITTRIILPIVAVVILLFFITGVRIVQKRRKQSGIEKGDAAGDESIESCLEFSFNTIKFATNDFSQSNKLGQGGFGTVYKGRLPNGRLVAVKRLVRHFAHREVEFKNEVQLVARLHHKNLVRLIGFCLSSNERILIYELALNGSLDHILFDPIKRGSLNWQIRYSIIGGVARGLLYLHEESQLRIIHRDLKASNVLLDESMNPKISDFGTARLFVQDQGSASRIVGTYGYMAPEYARFGKISVKIDVFSFGVLLLEIVSGRKNSTSENPKQIEHLLSKAWKCWTTGELLELIDPILLKESGKIDDITRCIHIGLLCVQKNAIDRPSMNEVVLKLEGCSQRLLPPSEPAYLMSISCDVPDISITADHYMRRLNSDQPTTLLSLSSAGFSSINEASFTHTYPEPR